MPKFQKLSTKGTPPSERSTPIVTTLGPYAYLFGGIKDDFAKHVNTSFDDFYRLNTETNTWEKLSPSGEKPSARGYGIAVGDTKRNQIIIFGGVNYSSDFKTMDMFNEMWAYSPADNKWTQLKPSGPVPGPRSKPTGWLVGDKWYVFGGVKPNWDALNDIWVYDIPTNTWTELIPNGAAGSPPPRHEGLGGDFASSKGTLTVYGGEVDFDKTTFSFSTARDTWEYDIATNKWRDVTPKQDNIMPPRNFASAVTIGDYLYVHGGAMDGVGYVSRDICGAPFNQRNICDEIWRFDLINHHWTKLGPCGDPSPRLKRTNATAVNGKMYIFAGWDYQWYKEGGPGQIWNTDTFCYEP